VSEAESAKEGAAKEGGLAPARGLAGLIAANISLIVAIMIYMGWAYENAYYRYFGLSPLNIGISTEEYLFFSLNLFNPVVVVVIVAVIAAAAAATRSAALESAAAVAIAAAARLIRTAPWLRWLDKKIPHGMTARLSDLRQRWWKPRAIVMALGGVLTAVALLLYGTSGLIPVNTYLVLAMLACGPLLLARALRGRRQGRIAYALAIVVVIVCGLWGGSVYANGVGTSAAASFAANPETEVLVYSVQPLAMSGDQPQPKGAFYPYLYEGLILLHMDSGTYYLLAAPGSPQRSEVYVITADDDTRVVLYPGPGAAQQPPPASQPPSNG
jgi:hypothetical protein